MAAVVLCSVFVASHERIYGFLILYELSIRRGKLRRGYVARESLYVGRSHAICKDRVKTPRLKSLVVKIIQN